MYDTCYSEIHLNRLECISAQTKILDVHFKHNTILVSDGTLKIETEDIVKEHYLKLQHTSVGHSSPLPSGLDRFLQICFCHVQVI